MYVVGNECVLDVSVQQAELLEKLEIAAKLGKFSPVVFDSDCT